MPEQLEPEQEPSTKVEFTDREKALLAGEDPDDMPAVSDERLDPVVNESESAVREEPVSRPDEQASAPESTSEEPPRKTGPNEELDYADDLSGTEEKPIEIADETPVTSWVTDDVRDMALGYGLNEDQLSQIQNKEDFDRLLPLLDAQAIAYHQQAAAQPPTQPPVSQSPDTPPSDPPPTQDPEGYKDGVIDVEYHKQKLSEKFDDEVVEALGGQLELLRAQQLEMANVKNDVLAQKQDFLEKKQLEEQAKFHDACDSMDASFLGMSLDKNNRPVKIAPHFADRRAKIAEAIESFVVPQILRQQQAQGIERPVLPSYDVLVQRAKAFAFGNDPTVPGTPARKAALAKQSASRRPVGSGNTRTRQAPKGKKDVVMDEETQVEELLDNPDLNELWNNYSNV